MAKKIKNPGKYIQRLKAQLQCLKYKYHEEIRRKHAYAGTCMVNWSSHVETEETCTGRDLGAFRVGDFVAVVGRILEVHEKENGSTIRFKRVQTKKVEAI